MEHQEIRKQSGENAISEIKSLIDKSGINSNSFYKVFKAYKFDRDALKMVFQQYYYYIRTFPKILAGTAHLVDNEFIRNKLSRTVVSELGEKNGKPHFVLFEDVLASIGVCLDDWTTTKYTFETESLVKGLEDIFLNQSINRALGAHYVIEEFGFPMIVALYEGFRKYDGWKHEDFNYFYLHMLVESDHVAWVRDAVLEISKTQADVDELIIGAKTVLKLLTEFWEGLNNLIQKYPNQVEYLKISNNDNLKQAI